MSQRSLIALHHLLPIGALAGALWLWARVMPQPTYEQLAALALYGVFALVMIFIRK